MKQMKRSRFRFTRRCSFFCACAALLGGCATGASHEAMVPPTVTAVNKHPQSVSVEVSGGQETDAMGKPQVANESFVQSLERGHHAVAKSLRAGAKAQAGLQAFGSYRGIDQPSFGFFVHRQDGGGMDTQACGYRCDGLAGIDSVRVYGRSG